MKLLTSSTASVAIIAGRLYPDAVTWGSATEAGLSLGASRPAGLGLNRDVQIGVEGFGHSLDGRE